MADFKKFDLTKNVPVTYGNPTGVAAQAADEPMQVGWLNVKYGTFFQLGELAASERTTEMLISGEVIRVYSGPGAKWACPDCGNAQRFSHRGCIMFADSPRATADVERVTITPALRRAVDMTRADLGESGSNYSAVRELLAFAESHIATTKPEASQAVDE